MEEAGDEDRDASLPDDAGLDETLALHRESLLVLLGDGHHRTALIAQFPEDARRHDSSGSCSYSCCRPRSRTFPPCMLPGEVTHPQSLHEGLEVLALGQLELPGNLAINNQFLFAVRFNIFNLFFFFLGWLVNGFWQEQMHTGPTVDTSPHNP